MTRLVLSSPRLAIALVLAPITAACSVDPPSGDEVVIHARFDTKEGAIPKPTDILRDEMRGRLDIPAEPEDLEGKSPAEIAVIRELNTRDGWPSRTTAEVSFSGAIKASSINTRTLRVFAVDGNGIRAVDLAPRGDPETSPDRVLIDPPLEGWRLGGRYFIAALGGEGGLAGENGERVVADATFWFLRVRESLLDHVGAIPGEDLGERRENAEKLEEIRLQLAPYFAHLETLGIARKDVVALWSFTITAVPEIVMDKNAGQMPLPSDFLRDPASGLIDIPVRDEDSELEREVKHDLREVDGFSLSADLTFEVSAPIDPKTLTADAVRVYAIDAANNRATRIPVTLEAKRGDMAVTLSLIDRPFAPATEHVLIATDALTDTQGRTVEPMLPGVLAMLDVPIFENGAPTIGSLDAESAARVEGVRKSTDTALRVLEESGELARARISAAWSFRTMSIVEPMLRARDAAEVANISPDPVIVRDEAPPLIGFPDVDRVFHGTILVPDALDPLTRKRRADGRFEPRAVEFTMTVPEDVPAGAPLRVAIFGHGLTAESSTVMLIAQALAAEGLAVISIDFPYHGERTHCTWSGPQCIVNPLGRDGELLCPNPCERGTTCAPDGQCVDSSGRGNHLSRWPPPLGWPQVSGGAFLEVENLTGTRDHFYQAVTDLSALYRSLREGDWRDAIGYEIDPDVGYVGQSLGGILGSIFAATHPEVDRVVLNVPGADLVELFRESTVFKSHMDAFLEREDVDVGTARHERLLNVARWVMDGIDPQNFAPFLIQRSIETGASLAGRNIIIQMAELDPVIGNEQTKVLERLSGVRRFDYCGEHAFLTIPIEPAYFPGTSHVAKLLGRGETPDGGMPCPF